MTIKSAQDKMSDIPNQVFDNFLQALEGACVSAELVGRLRKVLLEDKKFSERALKEAIFPEELFR